jgi:hypothetical protein
VTATKVLEMKPFLNFVNYVTIIAVATIVFYAGIYVAWRSFRGVLDCDVVVLVASHHNTEPAGWFEYNVFYPAIWIEVKYVMKRDPSKIHVLH